ncbi:polyribonucleotide nucleotidyltransferase [Jiulongibacter sediminis]|uniref:Polyribonucleotide nucleotidyltransferase n=1 Tax=Jiulongibacter sediminis TaxID=1605367 RepID=A0A0P7C4I7_9BACT|nr:polyribonucleotide nucleotidyltransferase [Jiulongibacter sediminis]KPM49594.1 polynucleotide phosphorylase [Jiulongibacter sediminis]TBX26633.1 polynucleotide phosphorylase [Jiulongibacter sediminis]
MFNIHSQTIPMPGGKDITLETGKLARQADGAVVLRCGNAMLLATVVAAKNAKDGVDFLPLSVDYQEKFASAGKIPGSFQRREGRLSDNEILISRLVDRALRPIFPDDYHADVQVMISMVSSDPEVAPDALAALAASAALAVSDIPFNGPVSEVRVAKINGEYVVNPDKSALTGASLDLIIAGTSENINMVEGEANEVSELEMIEAIKIGHEAIKKQVAAQVELAKAVGSLEKREYSHEIHNEELKEKIFSELYDQVYAVGAKGSANKNERKEGYAAILDAFKEPYVAEEADDDTMMLIGKYFGELKYKASRDLVLNERKRLDGRQLTEIRPIECEVDFLPGAHGSALFTRGETQSLSTCTVGTKLDEQLIDQAMYSGYSRFYLHYNFPGFSTGEVKPNRGASRREIGHGNLAQRSLAKVMPPDESNPYTVRIVSDILESNGSSSMATVCAGCLSLMDAGIPISAPVSGIAMGLISDSETGKWAVLSDILGDEDHLGDMDFKVTGTEKGIVACQMDIKVDGLSFEILEQALNQAKDGRLHILGKMTAALEKPREDMKPHAPRAFTMKIDREFIGAVIGPGGKIIQEIQRESGATVNIEEVGNEGIVSIFATNGDSMEMAKNRIKGIVAVPEVGTVYDAKVKSIQPFGAFCEFLPGKDGLLHISEITWERLPSMDGVLEVGEEIQVKLTEVDKKTGKFRLSRKVLLPRPPKLSQNGEEKKEQ